MSCSFDSYSFNDELLEKLSEISGQLAVVLSYLEEKSIRDIPSYGIGWGGFLRSLKIDGYGFLVHQLSWVEDIHFSGNLVTVYFINERQMASLCFNSTQLDHFKDKFKAYYGSHLEIMIKKKTF